MLTNSCVKLQTVHTIPMTMNKEGKITPSFNNERTFSYGLVYILSVALPR